MQSEIGSVYTTPQARREFWLFCVSTFLVCLTSSTISYLSVILSTIGMTEKEIGGVLSSPLLPVTLAILFSGLMIARYSALTVAIWGQVISLVAFLSFQFSVANPVAASVSRVALGLGFGLFFPAALVYAKSKLHGPKTAYLFGIYSSMIPLPNVIGPPIAEWYFKSFGIGFMFVVLSLPLIIGTLIMLTLSRGGQSERSQAEEYLDYWQLLKMKSLMIPLCAVLVAGLIWGFVVSFLALQLHRKGIPTSYFFSSCTVALFTSRFLVLGLLTHAPREVVAALGLALMAISFLALASAGTLSLVVFGAGIVFGFGYSMAFPVLSVWVSDQFRAEERGKPVALLSALFQFGIYALPFIVGISGDYLTLDRLLMILTLVAGAVSIGLVIVFLVRRRDPARIETAIVPCEVGKQ